MKIKATIVDYPQGSEAWKRHRARALNASELAVAMGISKYKTRAQLIAEKASGIEPDIDAETRRRFDKGHEYEASARPLVEEETGEALYPCVLAAEVEGLLLSASLDGMDLMQEMTWEHKTASAALIASLEAGVIPDEYHPQMEQGLMLSGASRCKFSASKGDRETIRSVWYESNPELRAKIIPTWRQFVADVAAYQPAEVVPAVVAEPVEALPAVLVKVSGEISITANFAAFETRLRDFLDNRLIREPKTDQDFADLDLQIKAMKGAEAALESAEAQMLAQIASVDTAKRTKDMLHKLVRDNRLMAEKLLASEKERRKAEIVAGGQSALREHVRALVNRVRTEFSIAADFAGVIKGKKSLSSMEDAISTELARAKIEANRIADLIDANRRAVADAEADHLFPDFGAVCTKPADDFANLITSRRAAAQARLEHERERIRAEEAARLELEQRLEADRQAREASQAEAAAQAKQAAEAHARNQAMAEAARAAEPAPEVRQIHPAAAALRNEQPTLTLGEIKARIAPLSIDAAGLESLGFPATKVKAVCMYRHSDWPAIHEAMLRKLAAAEHIQEAA